MAKVAFIIPAFDCELWKHDFIERMKNSVAALEAQGLQTELFWVDDASKSTTLAIHRENLIGSGLNIHFMSHLINRGQGAALQTGLRAGLRDPEVDYFVTFDSDGQHDPADAVEMLKEARDKGWEVVFGDRFSGGSEPPGMRRLILMLGAIFERALSGLKLKDAHNGLRVLNREFSERLVISCDRMAHATEIKLAVAEFGASYGEVPVRIHYSESTRAGGQDNLNAVNILVELFEDWWFK